VEQRVFDGSLGFREYLVHRLETLLDHVQHVDAVLLEELHQQVEVEGTQLRLQKLLHIQKLALHLHV